MPASRATRLMAASLDAQEQSVAAIRASLRLLRQPIYPEERPIRQPSRNDDVPSAPQPEGRDDGGRG